MESFLLGCFAFGFLFVFVTAAMGAAHGALDGLGIPHAHDAGPLKLPTAHADTGPLDGSGHGGGAGHWLATVNLSALMAFIMWFGGAGWLALKWGAFGVAGALGAGVAAGAGAYTLVAWVFHLLRASERVARAEDFELVGTLARVSVPLAAGGVGEIVFTVQGSQRVEGARTVDGKPLARGAEVVITEYRNGLAVVEEATAFIEGMPAQARERDAARLPPPRPQPEVEPEP